MILYFGWLDLLTEQLGGLVIFSIAQSSELI